MEEKICMKCIYYNLYICSNCLFTLEFCFVPLCIVNMLHIMSNLVYVDIFFSFALYITFFCNENNKNEHKIVVQIPKVG